MYTTYTDDPDQPDSSTITNVLYTSIPSYTISDHVSCSSLIYVFLISIPTETGCRHCHAPSIPAHNRLLSATPSSSSILYAEAVHQGNPHAIYRKGDGPSYRQSALPSYPCGRGKCHHRDRELHRRTGCFRVVEVDWAGFAGLTRTIMASIVSHLRILDISHELLLCLQPHCVLSQYSMSEAGSCITMYTARGLVRIKRTQSWL